MSASRYVYNKSYCLGYSNQTNVLQMLSLAIQQNFQAKEGAIRKTWHIEITGKSLQHLLVFTAISNQCLLSVFVVVIYNAFSNCHESAFT